MSVADGEDVGQSCPTPGADHAGVPVTQTATQPVPAPLAPAPLGSRQSRRQIVDPAVSRRKFAEQIALFRRHEDSHRSRGTLLIEASFPTAFLVLAAPHLRPAPVLFGLVIDFTNYDVEPPSVTVVDPWSKRVLLAGELVTGLLRWPKTAPEAVPDAAACVPSDPGQPDADGKAAARDVAGDATRAAASVPGGPPDGQPNVQPSDLLQAHDAMSIPFLCIVGTAEYHSNPGHSGNDWLLHRGRGEGTLDAILRAFTRYGVRQVAGYLIGGEGRIHSKPTGEVEQHFVLHVTGLLTVKRDE